MTGGQWRKLTRDEAERFARQTGATYVIVIAVDEPDAAIGVGAWTPTAGVARAILAEVVKRLDAGTLPIVDETHGGLS